MVHGHIVIGLLVTVSATALLFINWLVVKEVARGQLSLNISKFEIENNTNPLEVGVTARGGYQGYSPFTNRTGFMAVSFKNISISEKITVSGIDKLTGKMACELASTVAKLAKTGLLDITHQYPALPKCNITMRVVWTRAKE